MHTNLVQQIANLSDDDLLVSIKLCVGREREATATLVAQLAEVDARRLYLGEGCSSLFTYCTQILHLSEHAAYLRIEAARAARRFPVILGMLAEGAVHLTAVGLLSSHLTGENHGELLDNARHKSKRQVEELLARLRPQPPVAASVRKLPEPRPAAAREAPLWEATSRSEPGAAFGRAAALAPELPPARPAVVAPLAPERYKIQFTASRAAYEKLRLAQDLLRHQIPSGDPAAIFDRALTALLDELAKKKHAATDRPREGRAPAGCSRHIPADVKRQVWSRDGGQCAFVGREGRCQERGFLEFHHVVPFARGGKATAETTQLRCRAHLHDVFKNVVLAAPVGWQAELALGTRLERRPSLGEACPPRRCVPHPVQQEARGVFWLPRGCPRAPFRHSGDLDTIGRPET